MTFPDQLLSYGTVYFQALRLEVGSIAAPYLRTLVPIKLQPAQTMKDLLYCPLDFPLYVSILNTKDKATSIVPSK